MSYSLKTPRPREALLRHLLIIGLAFPLLISAAPAPDEDALNPKQPGDASSRAETDDPNARHEYMQQWYGGRFSPAYMKWLNDAAARERARNADLLPPLATADFSAGRTTSDATLSANTWVNLGPNKADYIKNGGLLHKTDSGRPVAIVPHPTDANILYLATAGGGVWKTTNAVSAAQPTWTPMTESLGSLSCGALAIDPSQPSTLYLGLGDSFDGTGIGLTKSTNGGTTWGPIVYLGDSTTIASIQVARDNPNIVLAATDAGVFRSINGGSSFSPVTLPGLAHVPSCWSLAWGGGTNFAVSVEVDPFSSTDHGFVFFSGNNGATWTKATGLTKPTGIGRVTIASSPANPAVMFAEAAIPNVYGPRDLADFFRSTDRGHTWSAMRATAAGVSYTNQNGESKAPKTLLNGQGWYNQLVLPSKVDQNTVYFGGALLVARVTKALNPSPVYRQMTNWLAQFNLPYVHADCHTGAYDAAGNLYVGSDGGIFRSGDNGVTWTDKLNIGIASHQVYSVASSEAAPSVVLGGMQDNGTRLRDGNTTTFNQQLGGDGFGAHVNGGDATKMLGSLYYARIYKSTNGGASFSPASSGIAESNDSGSAPFVTHLVPWLGGLNTIYTHVNLKVYKSTDYAGSWTPLSTNGFLTSGEVRNVGVAKANGNVIGAAANQGRIFLTQNGGASWQPATVPPNNGYGAQYISLSYISFNNAQPNTVYAASVAPYDVVAHLWKSTDFGATWTVLDANPGFPTGVPVNTIVNDPVSAQTLYAGTHLGVYRSLDGGSTWERFGANLPLVNVTDFYISPNANRMRISTFGRGFWELQL